MSVTHIAAALDIRDARPGFKHMLLVLAHQSNPSGEIAITQERLVQLTGFSVRSVHGWLKTLEAEGRIERPEAGRIILKLA